MPQGALAVVQMHATHTDRFATGDAVWTSPITLPQVWIGQRGSRYSSSLSGGATMDLGGYVLSSLRHVIEAHAGGQRAAAPWEVVEVHAQRWKKDGAIDEAMRGSVRLHGVLARFSWSLLRQDTLRTPHTVHLLSVHC